MKQERIKLMSIQIQPAYIEACVDAVQPFGDVLEVGFGSGFSLPHIQSYFPKSHTIIATDQEQVLKARDWMGRYSNIHVIEDNWHNSLDKLGLFDAIFFHEEPFFSEHTEARLFSFLDHCLSDHMRPGSRLSCCLHDPTSKYQDRIWLEKILGNPHLDYKERKISLNPYGSNDSIEGLIITIIKK